MRLKVSNVCQLLDKSKYNLPLTESGLTFTAGADGSIIVNGTCTSTVWAKISSFELNPEHTFILIGCPGTNVNDVALYTMDPVENDTKQWEEGKGSLVTGNWYKHKNNELWIRILTGYVCNNLTFKPQLFDLTEMYGAGHEPTTVAQFRQDFPNEMYEYSPVCWKKFRRLKYVTETKNLLSDISVQSPVGVSYDKQSGIFTINSNDKTSIGYSNSVMDFITPIPVGTVITVSIYCISGRYRATQGDNTAIGGYHKYVSSSDLNIWQGYIILPSGTDLSGKTFTTTWTVTKPLDAFWIYAPRQTDIIEEDIKFRAQLELGSTATPYQPYGYLPLNRGKYIANKEPVQLLDKSTYKNAIHNGITYTPNIEDGTWTITGTGTNFSFCSIQSLRVGVDFEVGDKLLLRNSSRNDTTYFPFAPYYGSNNEYLGEKDGEGIFTILNNTVRIHVQLTTRVTGVALNITTQVQLFNLTRMYGKGNEPTAAEFVAQYPGFDYSVNKYNAITFR